MAAEGFSPLAQTETTDDVGQETSNLDSEILSEWEKRLEGLK